MSTILIIPPEQLSADTLENLVQEFVTRDGTDYGREEISTAAKTAQVVAQLRTGQACIVYDSELDSCTIVPADDAKALERAALRGES